MRAVIGRHYRRRERGKDRNAIQRLSRHELHDNVEQRPRRRPFFTRADGSRLRYYTAGTSPPLVLIHTVRTQLDLLPASDSARAVRSSS